ncbi:zinc-dependent alcohol dehydrogenase [Paenibacillus oceani]|uniref:Zinc-binding alcohol dehydrogenase n=1 Tax=Paenibacillus oceani TaxID=2772510 RepID=A0A927CB69_9BACL|nr:zinc-binding alcohol dehydrogenase [Paenibacillus oceani]MBD2863377.1 zinc-binding alcohol dehydrogenase [Paenibacillus oceani]
MRAARSVGGLLEITDIPVPAVTDTSVLVETSYSAVSTGTELMVLRNGGTAFLGYSATGIVREAGKDVDHVKAGDRIVCYGAHTHADYFLAGRNHVAPIPDHVDPQEAAFAGIATIALQGLRQADLRFGETVVVLGLGIVGQLAAQIAHAAAYRVIAMDLMETRCQMLEQAGLQNVCRSPEQVQERVREATRGHGADCVLICANTKEHRLIDQALDWIRDKGKIVIVGDTNTEFTRNKLFAKEAQITISRAGGPGRYDKEYEQEGRDYPYGYIRWSLQRNLDEFARLLASGRMNLKPLVTGVYKLEQLEAAYERAKQAPSETMGTLIRFGE